MFDYWLTSPVSCRDKPVYIVYIAFYPDLLVFDIFLCGEKTNKIWCLTAVTVHDLIMLPSAV